MAYSDSFPSQRPSFMFDASNAGRIPPNMTYTRSTTGTYFGTAKHLSSENLILHSNGFDSGFAGTGTGRLAPTAGQSDPAGGTNAWRLSQQTGQTIAGNLSFTHTGLTVGQEYTWSIYVKNDGRTAPALTENFNVGSTQRHTWFDTSSTGTVGTSNAAHTPLITKLGDWFRITIRFTADVTSGYVWLYIASTDNSTSVADDGNGFYAYGASLSTTGQLVHETTSGQIHREYAPTLQTAAINAARFEHSASDGESMGILIEGQSQNLISYSSDSTQWTKAFSSLTGSAAVAPDGSLSATAWIPDTSLNGHYTHPTSLPTVASGTTYTGSVYVKSAGLTLCQLTWSSSGFGAGYKVNFNLAGSGSVVETAGGASGTISQCGNGWFRLTITAAATSSGSGVMVIGAIDSETSGRLPSYSGDGYNGLLLYGIQQETGSFASSLISTSGSQVSRGSDSLSVDLSAINHDPIGTDIALATEFRCNVVDTTFRRIAEMRMSSGSGLHNSHVIYNGYAYSYATDTSAVNQTLKSIANLGDTSHKLVSTQSGATAFAAGDGVAGNTKSSTAKDMIYDRLYIGSDSAGIRQLDGHISRVALYGNSISETNATALSK